MTRTFLDAEVLIAAIRGTPEIADRAMELLNDPERLFVSSDFVQLEVLPKAVYFRHTAEASFYRAYLRRSPRWSRCLKPWSCTPLSRRSGQAWPRWMRSTLPLQELATPRSSLRSSTPGSLYFAWKG